MEPMDIAVEDDLISLSGSSTTSLPSSDDDFSEKTDLMIPQKGNPMLDRALSTGHDVEAHWFKCRHEMNLLQLENVSISTFIGSGRLARFLKSQDPQIEAFQRSNCSLMGRRWVTPLALAQHTDKLFALLRQKILTFKNPISRQDLTETNLGQQRHEMAEFLLYICIFVYRYMDDFESHPMLRDYAFYTQQLSLSSALAEQLSKAISYSGHLFQYYDSLTPHQIAFRVSSSRPITDHLFHLHLDMHFCYIETLYRLMSKQCNVNVEAACIDILWELVMVASNIFSKASSAEERKRSLPFPCSCCLQVWLTVIYTTDDISKNYGAQAFWSVLNSAVISKILSIDTVHDDDHVPKNCSNQFNCKDPLTFSWWLLASITTLYSYDARGQLKSEPSRTSRPSNWIIVQDLLKLSLSPDQDIGEGNRRLHLQFCLMLSKNWGANTDVILWMWDYFHRRLNDSYRLDLQSIDNVPILSRSAREWMDKCVLRCQGIDESNRQDENSYGYFLQHLAFHLKDLLSIENSNRIWKQIKGRIYSKFHKRRMGELNAVGLHNFLSLYITLACIADAEDVTTKMFDLLAMLDSRNLETQKELIIKKGYFAMAQLYITKNMNIFHIAGIIVDAFIVTCNDFNYCQNDITKRRHLWDCVVLYTDSVEEIFTASKGFRLSEIKLLSGNGLSYLLPSCRENELRKVFSFLANVLSSVRNFLNMGNNMNSKKSQYVLEVLESIWIEVFPQVLNYFNKSVDMLAISHPAYLTDILAEFSLISLDHTVSCSVPFTKLFNDVGLSDRVIASTSCRYLCYLLQSPSAKKVLIAEYQTQVVHSWFRCSFQLPESDLQVIDFTRYICDFPEIKESLSNQKIQNSNSAVDLACDILINIGRALNQLHQSSSEYDSLRQKVLVYTDNLQAYIETFIASSGPRQQIQQIYKICATLVESCPDVIYSKTQRQCLLPRLIDMLLLPNAQSNPSFAVIEANIRKHLSGFINGLAKLYHLKKDEFLKRKIKQIFARYFLSFNQVLLSNPQSVSSHPFINSIRKTFTSSDCEIECQFRRYCMEIVGDHFLVFPQPPDNLITVLNFIKVVFENTKPQVNIVSDSPYIFKSVMACLLACDTCSPEKEPPSIRNLATAIIKLITNNLSCEKEVEIRNKLQKCLENFVESNFKQFNVKILKSLGNVAKYDSDMIITLLPKIRQIILQTEQNRGVGRDKGLRSGYTDFLEYLYKISAKQFDHSEFEII
ncbi:Protein MMS22-like [Trichoplax sp. H2]|nr:Protein MMS22-like [Trichoplax sp. H2]|eukprot:RDD43636.1 Protein MMS22-like [Trichoplax sp. H2]